MKHHRYPEEHHMLVMNNTALRQLRDHACWLSGQCPVTEQGCRARDQTLLEVKFLIWQIEQENAGIIGWRTMTATRRMGADCGDAQRTAK